MKVLFAVNNDKISEAVIKKYPKDYRELLSYKNVYYFNAILKEIQNDKSYDRIVISEDLEPFVNTNHDSIDNFLFSHLDKISDEAQGNDGKEISIILICSERRTFGSNILNKLFSIGIYNALIGNDRNMENLCKLINRPRTKKEAKIYYRIDQATYESAIDSGEVSETEIQNILNHFKKLGNNTERYTDSFNNIAGQYTDDQLKLIINVLPMKVKAVLESECQKYQMLMGTSREERRKSVSTSEPGIRVNTIGSGREANISGPIVIPSGVKRFTGSSRPVIPNNTAQRPQTQPNIQARPTTQTQNTVQQRPVQQVSQNPQVQARPQGQVRPQPQQTQNVQQPQIQQQVQRRPFEQPADAPVQSNFVSQRPTFSGNGPIIPSNVAKTATVSSIQSKPASVVKEPEKKEVEIQGLEDLDDEQLDQDIPEVVEEVEEPIDISPVKSEVSQTSEHKTTGQRYTGTIAQVKRTLIARRKTTPVGTTNTVQAPITQQPVQRNVNPIEETVEIENEEAKRGRGRPRKPVTEQEIKPKGKRGRPRKNPIAGDDGSLDNLLGGLGNSTEDVMMPGLEDDLDSTLPGVDDIDNSDDGMLPGLDDTDSSDDGMLPGLDDTNSSDDGMLPGLDDTDSSDDGMLPGLDSTDSSDDGMLPGLDDTDSSDDGMLPGLDNTNNSNDGMLSGLDDIDNSDDGILPGVEEDDGEEVDVNSLLAGLDDDGDGNSSLPGLDDTDNLDDGMLPGLDDTDSSDDGMLPGLDDTDSSDDGMLPGLDDTDSSDDGMLPGLDDTDSSDDGMLSGLDDIDNSDDGMLPGMEEDEESVLPGMGFDSEETDENPFGTQYSNSQNNVKTNAIESIKPQIDYSMSNLNSLLSKDKKIVTFVGATKNGTSFLINNLALMFSMMGVDTAILDMTQNKNSYYLFTDSREELRKIAYTSLSKLENGYADGIKFNKNLTVYTGLPSDGAVYENAEPILSTLVQNHSLVLIDSDFTTPPAYFASSQEIYLVQSMDILTIQPLTAFLRELKFKGAWEPEKARVVINKEVPIRILSNKTIIGGMSRYNGPDMSVMTDLFNKDMVKACSIPFDEKVYAKYLETLATCKLSISSLPKQFRAKLQILGEMVYPRLNSKTSYSPSPMGGGYAPQGNAFSSDTNNTLNKMKKKF